MEGKHESGRQGEQDRGRQGEGEQDKGRGGEGERERERKRKVERGVAAVLMQQQGP